MTERSRLHGFSNICEAVPTTSTNFLTPRIKHVHDWWTGVAAAGEIPRKSAFDVTGHGFVLPHLFLIKVRPDGNFLTTIVGEAAKQYVEPDRSGKVVTPHDPDPNIRLLHDHYGWIVAHGKPLHCVGSLAFSGREWHRFEALDCPLSADGRRIVAILGIMDLLT